MYLNKNLSFFNLEVGSQEELLNTLADCLRENGCVNDQYATNVINREKNYPTGLFVSDTGFAIPHSDSVDVYESQICFASLKKPVTFSSMINVDDKIEVSMVFMLAMKEPHEQVKNLSNLMALFQDKQMVEELLKCESKTDFIKIMDKAEID